MKIYFLIMNFEGKFKRQSYVGNFSKKPKPWNRIILVHFRTLPTSLSNA